MAMEMGLDSITKGLDFIPAVIARVREFVIKITETMNFPSDSYMLVFLAIALVLAYYWTKHWITYSVFYKLSTILNWLLLALVLFLLFTKVG